ncbi:MAG: peptidase S46 [Bacteroidetes bacterium RIFCSPLOWO2_02_FULL_36_8]|nr:MAG: peptidase S46 [Bacteroidetes bacterium RIFCSPLOWO2_02_FULL_36_8]OFY69381.1 MAG: peptidase S46 [Bacteroidetes bacterium RIFCSPLOWO2_12_FULL_37_12]
MFPLFLTADEGMWLPLLLEKNYSAMEKLGFKLTPDQIYNLNKSSLKDAIINFGGFCSGSIISKDGLILTNHHCGYDAIQNQSTVENNYLKNGFWALSKEQELSNPGLSATFLVRVEDVTQKVMGVNNENAKYAPWDSAMQSVTKKIVEETTKGTNYSAEIKDFYGGNTWYLFVYETYRDIRLVGAPPESIGKFGGDADNWMWPRHTGDFSLFRVYTAPDGKPSAYAKENIPLKPKYYLPVSLKGIQPKDFAMVMGYPGRTRRYETTGGIKFLLEQSNPTRIKLRGAILRIMKIDMDENEEIKLKLSSHYASVSNYHKNFIGQNKGLVRMNTIETKKAEEDAFRKWVSADATRKAKYGTCLDDILSATENLKGYNLARDYMNELLFSAGGVLQIPYLVSDAYKMMKKPSPNPDTLKTFITETSNKLKNHFKEYNYATDKKIFTAVMKMYYNDAPKLFHPTIFDDIEKIYKNDFNAFTDDVFNKSILTSEEKLQKFLLAPNVTELENDLGFKTMQSVLDSYNNKILPLATPERRKLGIATRLYLQGLMEMKKDKQFYPDANFSMRLTYGKVIDYIPKDAVKYSYFTTLDGIIEKYDPWDEEFFVPQKLMDLQKAKDYGQYVDAGGKLYVCFITDNDITGGNSGSSVMNGKGELIGLAFDNNWEGMTGDLVYDGTLKRCINVDVRYILFIIDKFGGAKNIVDEMTLVK